jgi:calcium-dependent protein kinase
MGRLADLKEQWELSSKCLGEGAFGKVYLGTNKKDPEFKVAIKVINKRGFDKGMLVDLENEIKLMHLVDHPNIAKHYETYDEQNYIYMVMELCPNGDLYDMIIRNGHLTEKETSEIMLKVVKALNHCHSMNIIHRDIKPENIVFGQDGEPKLVDFGFAIEQAKE